MLALRLTSCAAAVAAFTLPARHTRGGQPLRAAAAVDATPFPPLVWSPEGVKQADGTLCSKTYAFDASALPYASESGVGSIQTAYIAVGDESAPPVLLVHGFGASACEPVRHSHEFLGTDDPLRCSLDPC